MPGVTMTSRQLGARNGESPAHTAGANDKFFSLKPQTTGRFDGVGINEARITYPLIHSDPYRIDLLAES